VLVLSRHEDERIMIGDDIEIVVRRIHGNRVSIGIEAPKDFRIDRKEPDPCRKNSIANWRKQRRKKE